MATKGRPNPAGAVFLLCFSVLWAFRSRAWLLPFHGDAVAFDLPYARALAQGTLSWSPDSAAAVLWHPPLYPAAVALIGRLSGWSPLALGMAGFAAAAALAAAAFALARRRLPLGWAALAALAVIASPAILGEAARVQGDIPAAALLLWALHLALERRTGLASALLAAAVLTSMRMLYLAPLVAWAAALSPEARAGWPRTLATMLAPAFAAGGAWIAFVLAASNGGASLQIPPVEALAVPSHGGFGPLAYVAHQLLAEDGRWVAVTFLLAWVGLRLARTRSFAHVGSAERLLLGICAVDVITAAGAGSFRLREIALSSAVIQVLGAFGVRGILDQIRERSPAGSATSPLVASAAWISLLGLALLPAKGVLSWEGPPAAHADLGARRGSEGLPRLVADWWAELEARRGDRPFPEIVTHFPLRSWLADPFWEYVSEAPAVAAVEEEAAKRTGDVLYVFAWDEWGASRPGKAWIAEKRLALGLTACAQAVREGWTLEVCDPRGGAEPPAVPASAPPREITSPREARPRIPTSRSAE